MRLFSVVTMIGVFICCVQADNALGHTDVQFSYVDGKIDIEPGEESTALVFESDFPTFGIEQQFATLPGFASEAINGLGIGGDDQVFYDVLDDLLYWDGTNLTTPPDNHRIRVENTGAGVPDTIIDENSGEQLGGEDVLRNRIGAANGSGDFHVDLRWRLEPLPSPSVDTGAYGVKLRLTTSAEGIAHSDPVIFAFNFGLNNTGFEQAVEAFGELLAPGLAGDFDEDGDVDGQDLLIWQRGSPPDPPSAEELNDWQSNYGTSNQPPQQVAITIPEPETVPLCLFGLLLLFGSKYRFRSLRC